MHNTFVYMYGHHYLKTENVKLIHEFIFGIKHCPTI